MTRSLSGDHAINRYDPPEAFYTPSSQITTGRGMILLPGVHVLAKNGTVDAPDRLCVGIVSKHTPYGQGQRLGLKHALLRRATAREVRSALTHDHPQGESFRPRCIEADFLQAILDDSTRVGPPDPVLAQFAANSSRRQVEKLLLEYLTEYRAVIANWPYVMKRQAKAILEALPS